MFSILRRSHGAAVIPKYYKKKFAPLSRRFVSTSSVEHNPDAAAVPSFPRDYCGNYYNAINTFNILLDRGYSSISYYNYVLSTLARMGSSGVVVSLFEQLKQSSQFNNGRVVPNIHTWTILIQSHSRAGNMSSAIDLFHKIIDTGHYPTTQTLNDLLDGFCRRHQIHQAIHFLNDIILTNSNLVLNCRSYSILIDESCDTGETQIAIQLLRDALQIGRRSDPDPAEDGYLLKRCCNNILFRLCKDKLVNQAYDLCSEINHVDDNDVKPDAITYLNLIYGHCILTQFKQALALFREMETSTYLLYPTKTTSPTNLVTEQEVKSAKTAAAVMIKGGVKPNAASYHSVIGRLYKGRSSHAVMNKIAQKVEDLLFKQNHHKRYNLNLIHEYD